AALLASGLALTADLVSRTVGMPEIHDDIGNWLEPFGVAAVVAEAVGVVTAARILYRMARRHR
ncbi:MAG: hypothetical protein ACRDQ1_16615, partial [Sciscionella sp.]